MENVCWKETGLLSFVWVAFLGLQIGKVFIFPYPHFLFMIHLCSELMLLSLDCLIKLFQIL